MQAAEHSEDVVKGGVSYVVNCIDACNLDSFICAYGQIVSEGCSLIIAGAVEASLGYHDRAYGSQVHLPGQWLILKHQGKVPSFRF